MDQLARYETPDYPYTFARIAEDYRQHKDTYAAFFKEAAGMKVSEAAGTFAEAQQSTDLVDFYPRIFAGPPIITGLVEPLAQQIFGTDPQTTGNEFWMRYRSRSEPAQVFGELEELQATETAKDKFAQSHIKVGDFPLRSMESIEDALVDETTVDIQLAITKINRRINMLMAHILTLYSQGGHAAKWGNHEDVDDYTLAKMDIGIRNAMLRMISRFADAVPKERLQGLWAPAIFADFYNDETRRRFDILGAQPVQVTGADVSPYRIPFRIWESGYFTTAHKWKATGDAFIFDPLCARIRERASLRITPFNEPRNQSSGPILWWRGMPYSERPYLLRRISPNAVYADILPDLSRLRIKATKEEAFADIADTF